MEIVSAGVILKRGGKYLLIKNFRGEWGFPKGHVEEGEREEDAAIRECLEETGIKAKLTGDEPQAIEYPIKKGGSKKVIYFPAEYVSGEFIQNDEVETIAWLSFEEAYDRLTFNDTKEFFNRMEGKE